MKTDAQIICEQMLFVHHEEEELVERDAYAPEPNSSNHAHHTALLAEFAMLAKALTKAPPPTTPKGIRTLAEVAMSLVDAERTPEDHLLHPENIAEWITLRALSSAAGRTEEIPLPEQLPDYWPA